MKDSNDMMKQSKDEGVVHNQTWKSASENSLVFILFQDQLAEYCNITFSFYFGRNAWLMILNFYPSPGTFNIRGFIFQWIKSLVWGQYVVYNIIYFNINLNVKAYISLQQDHCHVFDDNTSLDVVCTVHAWPKTGRF